MNRRKRAAQSGGPVTEPASEPLAHTDGKGSSRRTTSSLVALGSAAVLSVYAAGYFRTRPAAERFAVEAAERRPAARASASNLSHTGSVLPSAQPLVQSDARAEQPAPAADWSERNAVAKAMSSAAAKVSSNGMADRPSRHMPADPSAGSATSPNVAPSPRTDSTTRLAAPTTAVTPATPTGDSTTAGAGQGTDSTAQVADKDHATLKDGTYSGWGTSRHGDIEASVEIKDGRIVSATITQCLTRYSCSWIAALPGQVVSRQSAEVDFVSGATQSTNAFYYAVLEALSKAK